MLEYKTVLLCYFYDGDEPYTYILIYVYIYV